LIALVGC
jgi:hypothetical protein